MEDEAHLQPSAESEDGASVDALTSELPPDSPQPGVEDTATTRSDGSPPGARRDTTAQGLPLSLGLLAAGSLRGTVTAVWFRLRRRKSRRSVQVRIGGDALELSGASAAQQEQLIELWLKRHTTMETPSGTLEMTKLAQEELDRIYSSTVERALSTKEVEDGAQNAGLDKAFLRNHAEHAAAEVWRNVSSERDRFAAYVSNPNNRMTLVERNRLFPWIKTQSQTIFPWEYLSLPTEHAKIRRPQWLNVFLGWSGWPGTVGKALGRLGTAHARLVVGDDALEVKQATREQQDRLLQGWDARFQSGRLELEQALLNKGMLPFMRTLLNEYLAPSYNTKLSIRRAPGLSEVFDPIYQIRTQSASVLQRLMEQMPGGSIGISGPRGVGKTTLIRSYTSDTATSSYALSVMVSAPVDYAARDFILHLFETVCRKISGPESDDFQRRAGIPSSVATGKPFADHKINLVALGLVVAAIGGSVVLAEQFHISTKVVWTVVGAVIAALGVLMALVTLVSQRSAPRAKAINRSQPITALQLDQLAPLRILASQKLQEIKFQQSFSTGWSGTLKIPIGVEGNLTGNTTLAQLQETLPDIVESLKKFLSQVARAGRVIIGIDELDKIGSDEKARQFLSDIKGIFGLEDCFYLVSVSEEAVASFERRGLPFRDVFDSSFDEIIRVPYLGFDDAKRMLARRVLGLPVPFAGLCYCLSGGLPRDLIRAARRLIDISHPSINELELGHATSKLLRDELVLKTQAVVAAAIRIDLEPEVSQVIRWADALDFTDLRSEELLDHCRRFEQDNILIGSTPGERESSQISRQSLWRLSRELLGLYYYSSTLLEFFDDGLEPARLQEAEKSEAGIRSLDFLARSRNTFAINASVAWAAVSKFRSAWSMEMLQLPESLLV